MTPEAIKTLVETAYRLGRESTNADMCRLLDEHRDLTRKVENQKELVQVQGRSIERLRRAVQDALNNLPKRATECRVICARALRAE